MNTKIGDSSRASTPSTNARAVADVDAEQRQPPEGGRGVDQRDPSDRPLTPDVPVVEGQKRIEVAELDVVERLVDPVVVGEVAVLPVIDRAAEERDALLLATLHLEDVGERMRGPDVTAVLGERGASGGLGAAVVAGLLEAERVHALHPRPTGQVLAPRGDHACHDIPDITGVAEEVVEVLGDPKGKEISGMADQRLIEVTGGALPVTIRPGGRRVEMKAFASWWPFRVVGSAEVPP